VRVIADIDVLREEALLKRLVEALGGDWGTLAKEWRQADAAARQQGSPRPTVATVRAEYDRLLRGDGDTELSLDRLEELRRVTRTEDGWKRIRSSGGVAAFPQGQGAQALARLLAQLNTLGLYVVPVGELERWATDVAGHGPRWVAAALERGMHERSGAHADFVGEVHRSFSGGAT
jgi:hypothetical protein